MVVETESAPRSTPAPTEGKVPIKIPSLPVVGNSWDFMTSSGEFAKDKHEYYGDVFEATVLGSDMYYLRGQKAAEFVFFEGLNSGVLGVEDAYYRSAEVLLGRTLPFVDGKKHTRLRMLLAPPFAREAMARQMVEINLVVKAWADKLVDRYTTEGAGPVNMLQESRDLAFKAMMRCMLDVENEKDVAMLEELFAAFSSGLTSFGIDLPGTKFNRALKARSTLIGYIQKLVVTRRAELDKRFNAGGATSELPPPSLDVLSLLMSTVDDEGNKLSDEELAMEVLIVMFTGHETLLTTICRLIQETFSPENTAILKALRTEQMETNPFGAPLTFEHIAHMPYTSMVIKETFRRWSSAPFVCRKLKQDYNFDGYHLQKGKSVAFCIITHNLNEENYDDPLSFRPERFAAEKPRDANTPFELLSFGGGQRFCLGRRFADVLMHCTLEHLVRLGTTSVHFRHVAGQDLRPTKLFFTRSPKSGMLMHIERIPVRQQ